MAKKIEISKDILKALISSVKEGGDNEQLNALVVNMAKKILEISEQKKAKKKKKKKARKTKEAALDKFWETTFQDIFNKILSISNTETTNLEIIISTQQQKYEKDLIKMGIEKSAAKKEASEIFDLLEKALEKKKQPFTEAEQKKQNENTAKEQKTKAAAGRAKLENLRKECPSIAAKIEGVAWGELSSLEDEITTLEAKIKEEMDEFVENETALQQVVQDLLGSIKTTFVAKKTELETAEKERKENEKQVGEIRQNYINWFNSLSQEDKDLQREHNPHPYMPPRS